jgi:hypothetical protein
MVNRIYTHTFDNISADTADFTARGGLYGLSVSATWGGGNVTISRKDRNNVYIPMLSSALTANGYQAIYLPSGTYKIAVTTATGVYVELVSIAQAV